MILTTKQLAERWGCSRAAIYEMVYSGRLDAFRVGKNGYRFRLAEVERYEKGETNEDS